MIVEIKNRHKKCYEERVIWWNQETKVGISIRTGYRQGTARLTIESLDDLLADPDDSTDDDSYEIDCTGFGENYEFVDSWDTCWVDFETWCHSMTPEEVEVENERLESIWNEKWHRGLEAEGFTETDTEDFFYGPIDVEIIQE